MNFEELHNDLNSFPDDLKYSDANWEAALAGIKAHENRKKRAAWFATFSAVLVVGVASLFALQYNSDTASNFTPRQGDYTLLDWEDTLENVTAPVNESHLERQSHNNKESNNDKELKEPIENSNTEKVVLNANRKSSVSSDSGRKVNTGLAEKNNSVSPVYVEESTVLPKPEVVFYDSAKKEFQEPKVELAQPSYLTLIPKRFSLLASSDNKPGLKGEKISLGNKGFKTYSKFLALKAQVSPWAEFGRSAKLGKLNPTYGLEYQALISPKFSWGVGVEYSSIENIDLPVSSHQTAYGLGFESNVTTAHTNKIHLINAPLNLVFRPTPRVQLTTGLGLSYLLTADNTLEEHFVTNSSSTLLKSSEEKGYITSFNQVLLFSRVGIQYWITERNSLQFGFQYGFSDISSNEAFNSDVKHKNSKINLGISRIIR